MTEVVRLFFLIILTEFDLNNIEAKTTVVSNNARRNDFTADDEMPFY